MSDESLEERIDKPQTDTKPSLWDFFVAAYSSSRGIKVLLDTLIAGYSYAVSIGASIGFYLSTKTMGIAIKYIARVIRNPFKEHNPLGYIKRNIGQYNPFGHQKRPHFMGASLSTIGYLTGF